MTRENVALIITLRCIDYSLPNEQRKSYEVYCYEPDWSFASKCTARSSRESLAREPQECLKACISVRSFDVESANQT